MLLRDIRLLPPRRNARFGQPQQTTKSNFATRTFTLQCSRAAYWEEAAGAFFCVRARGLDLRPRRVPKPFLGCVPSGLKFLLARSEGFEPPTPRFED